jgi:hypothetical protein
MPIRSIDLGVQQKSKKGKSRAAYKNPAPPPFNAQAFGILNAEPLPIVTFMLREDGSIAICEEAPRADQPPSLVPSPPKFVYRDDAHGIWLYHGNSLELLDVIAAKYPQGRFDCIFADPPYFLSNGGITCHAGRMVKVDKGRWDKSRGAELNHEFNLEWLRRCQRVLKPNGTCFRIRSMDHARWTTNRNCQLRASFTNANSCSCHALKSSEVTSFTRRWT